MTRPGPKKKLYKRSELEALLNAFQTHTAKELALTYGVSSSTITKRLRLARETLGPDWQPTTQVAHKRVGPPKKTYKEEELDKLLNEFQTHTAEELARAYKVSTSTITKRIRLARDTLGPDWQPACQPDEE